MVIMTRSTSYTARGQVVELNWWCRMQSLILLLLSCKGCGAWWVMPPLPTANDNSQDESEFDTAIEDPEEDSGVDDLPPPSACAFDEIEPNGDVDDPQDLPLEAWMCGAFEIRADNDYFAFEIETESWIHLWVRAQDLGSFANPRAFLLDENDASFSASLLDSFQSADLDYVIKLDKGRELNIGLLEQDTLYGEEDYYWRMRVSVVKPPVEWNTEEPVDDEGVDFNNSRADADSIANGDRLFGRLERNKNDYYSIELTDEPTFVSIQTESWVHGSPLNPCLTLVETPAGEIEDPTRVCTHDTEGKFDSQIEFTSTEAGSYIIKLDGTDSTQGGQPFWYVLDVRTEAASESDTGPAE